MTLLEEEVRNGIREVRIDLRRAARKSSMASSRRPWCATLIPRLAQRFDKIGLKLYGFAEAFLRFLDAACAVIARPERIERYGVRLQVRRLLQRLGRFGQMSQLGKQASQVDIGLEERGRQADRRSIFRDRLFGLLQGAVSVSKIVMRFHEIGIEFDGFFQSRRSLRRICFDPSARWRDCSARLHWRVDLRRPVVGQDGFPGLPCALSTLPRLLCASEDEPLIANACVMRSRASSSLFCPKARTPR